MRDRVCRRSMVGLSVIGAVLLASIQVSCGNQAPAPDEATIAYGVTMIGPEIAETLTAWPTSAPIVTRPATHTPAPKVLWTAPPEPTPVQPYPTQWLPSATPTTPAAGPTEPATLATLPVPAAPLGTNPAPERLLLPVLGLDLPVVEVSWDVVLESSGWKAVWQTASNAAGHHCNSANPGEAGNVVISGHHNTAGEVFREVSEIGQPGSIFGLGDEIILVAQDGREYTYVVSRWDRFQEEGASDAERRLHALYLDQTSDPILTLVTCWPYEARTHRVVVIAELQP